MEPQKPLSLDYLNEISPKKKSFNLSKRTIIIGAGVGLVVIIVAMLALFSSSKAPQLSRSELLVHRVNTLSTVSKGAEKHTQSSEVRAANSMVISFAKNAVELYGEPNVNKKAPSATAVAENKNRQDLEEALDDARLNATYDRVYNREMSYQLETIQEALSYLESETTSKASRENYRATLSDVEVLLDRLEKSSY